MAANKISAFHRQFHPEMENTISFLESEHFKQAGIRAISLLTEKEQSRFRDIEQFLSDEQPLEHQSVEIPIHDEEAKQDATGYNLSFKTGTLLDDLLVISTENNTICLRDDCILTFDVSRLSDYISKLKYYSEEFILYDEDKFFVCEHCGRLEETLYSHLVNVSDGKEYWCQDCVDEDSFFCSECCRRYSKEDFDFHVTYNGYLICERCYESDYFTCEECGRIFPTDELHEYNDEYYCADCYDSVSDVGSIRSYHNNPQLEFHSLPHEDTDRYIGCEIETECIHNDRESLSDRIDCTNKYGEDEFYIYQMHDGSLDDTGIECITQPMTKKFFDKFNFEGWMKELIELGTRSHDTGDCGLHVHLSKTWFGSTNDKQETIAGIVIDIMGKLKPQLQVFSRRNNTQWCHYPDEPSFQCDKKEAIKKANEGKHYTDYKKEIKKASTRYSGRYECLNTTNSDTYEFRIFRGTLNPRTFRASIELCLRLVEYAKYKCRMNNKHYSWENFKTFKKMPKVLADYIVLRNL